MIRTLTQTLIVFLSILLAIFLTAPTSTSAPQAQNMIPTTYDDGKSCPNNCDAHVVFHPSVNGTRNAFDPSSSRESPRKCVKGQLCKICFSQQADSCMLAMYRGAGPDVDRFDFTPAFYEENCSKPQLPLAFARKCRTAEAAIANLRTQINCIEQPTHEKCRPMMDVVVRRKAADDLLYAECKQMGEAAFNQKYKTRPAVQRSNDCEYEKLSTGSNSHGQRWRRLLDGTCNAGSYVGKDGLDCCSGSLFSTALLESECRGFYVR
jgi:hypothetical protein